jgi:hypothetical protein
MSFSIFVGIIFLIVIKMKPDFILFLLVICEHQSLINIVVLPFLKF